MGAEEAGEGGVVKLNEPGSETFSTLKSGEVDSSGFSAKRDLNFCVRGTPSRAGTWIHRDSVIKP